MSPAETTPAMSTPRLDAPELYLNRELSLLSFQQRVFGEAKDEHNPLLERVKFLSILGSNLDEFFMVRVAGLWQQIESGNQELSIDGRLPSAQLELIRHEITNLFEKAYTLWRETLLPQLEQSGIHIVEYEHLSEHQRAALEEYFLQTVYPVLTPLAVDPGRPFPHISNLSLNIAVEITEKDGLERFARVKVPSSLPQLVPVPSDKGEAIFVWLERLIIAHLKYLFPELSIAQAHIFHVTRDAEIVIQELETDDLLETIEEAIWKRRFRDAVRLQINPDMPQKMVDLLTTNLELDQSDVYRMNGPVDIGRLRSLLSLERPDLKDRPFVPAIPPALLVPSKSDIFPAIQQGDILLHHPYDSFQPVIDFLAAAARDPDVLAIKTTLYRVGRNSPIVAALLDAIQEGKQVAALVELKARFDEESNIEWAKALEAEGVHVVYGLLGLKVHSKVAMVVRREGDRIRRYVHLGTGNYNPVTAKLYTDLGLFTCDEKIGADVSDLFNYLTGYSAKKGYRKLLVAPLSLRTELERMIEEEIASHEKHGGGHIILKVNALDEPKMIQALYRASQAGVQIDLIVRGVCSLRPGLPGVSENIRVKSIIGRFLEHGRIFYFRNNGDERVYMGSADLMPRNLYRRVEVVFPVESPRLVRRVRDEILAQLLTDEFGSHYMQSDGSYTHPLREPNKELPNAQGWFLKQGMPPERALKPVMT